MSKPYLAIFGLGPGSGDDISIGTIKRLKGVSSAGNPVFLRTERHPSLPTIIEAGVTITRSFDDIYEQAERFEQVYSTIAEIVLASVRQNGSAAYLVPGHPLIGEKSVNELLRFNNEFDIEIFSSGSFIDACLATARQEVTGLVVLDGLSLTDNSDPFRNHPDQFLPHLPHLIYQVFDRQVASQVKLALLECYPPEHLVLILSSAGIPQAERVKSVLLRELDFAGNTFDHLSTVFVPPSPKVEDTTKFSTLLDIMAKLRHPITGCPWDREQTPETLKRYAVEEVYEVLEAIDEGDVDKYVEELGDLILQVVFHAQLAKESGDFAIDEVLQSINEKLIRRHPHVFGNLSVAGSDEVLKNWEAIKRSEKGNLSRKSRLDGVPKGLPALAQALEISKRAAKAGFEWDSIEGVFEKLDEELIELREALVVGRKPEIASELGDLLFTMVNIARFAKVDAEDSLRVMVQRFGRRFRSMEAASLEPLENLDQAALELLWQAAKREERDIN